MHTYINMFVYPVYYGITDYWPGRLSDPINQHFPDYQFIFFYFFFYVIDN